MAEKQASQLKRTCHFEAREDIMTKLKSQALYITRIKYWNAGGNGNPPSFIPALWNIGILLIKRPLGPNNMTARVVLLVAHGLGQALFHFVCLLPLWQPQFTYISSGLLRQSHCKILIHFSLFKSCSQQVQHDPLVWLNYLGKKLTSL
jgi:hypothetical protein